MLITENGILLSDTKRTDDLYLREFTAHHEYILIRLIEGTQAQEDA